MSSPNVWATRHWYNNARERLDDRQADDFAGRRYNPAITREEEARAFNAYMADRDYEGPEVNSPYALLGGALFGGNHPPPIMERPISVNAPLRDVEQVERYFADGICIVPNRYPVDDCVRAFNAYLYALFERATEPFRRAAREARAAANVERVRRERIAAEDAERRAATVDALNAEIGRERAARNQPARQPREIERAPRSRLSEAEEAELSNAFAGVQLAHGRNDVGRSNATRAIYVELHNALTKDEKLLFASAFVNSALPFEFAVDARVWYEPEKAKPGVREIRSALAFMGGAIARDDTFMSSDEFRVPLNDPDIEAVRTNLKNWFHRMPDSPRVDACLQAYNLYVIDRFEQGLHDAQARADRRSRAHDPPPRRSGAGLSN